MRLTYKYDGYQIYQPEDILEAINKLGQLEDIEEELGIDLITLFKALKNGIKAKWEQNEIVEITILGGCQLWLNKKCFQLVDYNGKEWSYYFKDYGKTWALTKEELL